MEVAVQMLGLKSASDLKIANACNKLKEVSNLNFYFDLLQIMQVDQVRSLID